MNDLTAVVLCGGKGERLRPYTESIPKPLIELKGKPLLYHLIHYLAGSGVRRFVLCIGYKAEMIRDFAARFHHRDVELICVDSGDVSMTDRILDAWPHVCERALVCYGDTLANLDIQELHGRHRRSGMAATLTVFPLRSPFGIVSFEPSGRVTSFAEKPCLPFWINIGFLLCEREALEFMVRSRDMPDFLAALAAAGRLQAYQHRGRHLTVNTQKDLMQAEVEITDFYTILENR